MTWSTCAPQPDQLVRSQEEQVAGEHLAAQATNVSGPTPTLSGAAGAPRPAVVHRGRAGGPQDADRTMEGRRMSINRTRGFLYTLARVLGDVQAVRKGRVGRRVGRRVAGRIAGRGMGRLFR